MWTLLQIGIIIAVYVYSRATAPDPPKRRWENNPRIPRAEEGTPLPLIYGRIRVRDPALVWWGNFTHRPGWAPFEQTTVYGLDALFVLGIPPVVQYVNVANPAWPTSLPRPVTHSLMRVWVGDKFFDAPGFPAGNPNNTTEIVDYLPSGGPRNPNGPTGITGGAQVQLDLGGPGAGGKLVAAFAFWDGHEGGLGNNYQDVGATISDTNHPGYAHQLCVYMYAPSTQYTDARTDIFGWPTGDTYGVGESPQLPEIGFEVGCANYQFYGAGDANPADVIQDLITGTSFGKLGMDPSVIDTASFAAARAVLVAENHGYSRYIADGVNAAELLGEIVQQVGAVLFVDESVGQYKFKLIRGDYLIPSLLALNPTNVTEVDGYSSSTPSESFNQVRINFTDRHVGYDQGNTTSQSLANAVGQSGRIRSKTISYPGTCERSQAEKLAGRDLGVLSRPFAKCKIVANRDAADLLPGDCVRLTWPDHNLVDMVFRVMDVDIGELHDNRVHLSVMQDSYADVTAGYPSVTYNLFLQEPCPVVRRLVEEAPRLFQKKAGAAGYVSTPETTQRIWSLVRNDYYASSWKQQTKRPGSGWQDDVSPVSYFTATGLVSVAVTREKEPYDTVTGITFNSLIGLFVVGATYTATSIANTGEGLAVIGNEIIAYESCTDLGGGAYRLNNVWRALLDTAPVAHAIGEVIYFVGSFEVPEKFVGRMGWGDDPFLLLSQTVLTRTVPTQQITGSSNDLETALAQFRIRCQLPARAADCGLVGAVMSGTQGIPVGGGGYKVVSSMEDSFGVSWRPRDRRLNTVSRGDGADEDLEAQITYEIGAKKVGGTEITLGAPITGQNSFLLGGAGYGDLDVLMHTKYTRPAGSHGVPLATSIYEWQAPMIRVRAERWRNLIANPRWEFNGAGTIFTPGWGSASNVKVATSVDSITKNINDAYLTVTGNVTGSLQQDVDVSGYLARRWTGFLEYYGLNRLTAVDSITVVMTALDNGGASLGNVTDGPWVPTVQPWQRRTISIANLPAGTVKLRVAITLNGASSGADGVCVTEFRLQLGQMLDNVLTNPSFPVNVASWTVGAGGFVQATGINKPSGGYAQGGAFASSNIWQEYTPPAGWEEGSTAVLQLWRAQTLASDTGAVTLEWRDAGGTVLANIATPFETLTPLNQWFKRRLSLNSVPGATKIRVTLSATRTAGAGNSGSCFDDVDLQLHKDVGDARTSTTLTLNAPSVQPMPATWAEYRVAYQAIVETYQSTPDVMAGDSMIFSRRGLATMEPVLRWSDGAYRPPWRLVGQFGNGNTFANAFRFLRGSGANAIDVQAFGNPDFGRIGGDNFTVMVFFTVDETGFATACGLIGRKDALGGWAIDIDATGHLVARLQGASGAISVTRTGSTVHDGALHMACLQHDWNGDVLYIHDERGFDSVSSVACGDLSGVLSTTPERIGRSTDTTDVLPGKIARVYQFPDSVLLTPAEVASHWNYGKDPNGLLTYSRGAVAWTAGVPDATTGETLVLMASDQMAMGYDPDLTSFADGNVGQSCGLALSNTPFSNLVPTFDVKSNVNWVVDGGAAKAQGPIDTYGPNGTGLGVQWTGLTTTAGITLKPLVLSATTVVTLDFYAYAHSGTPVIAVELQNSAGVVKNTQTLTLTGGSKWTRYRVFLSSWDASTANGQLRFRANAGTIAMSVCEVMFVCQSDDLPTLWPRDALGTMPSVTTASMNPTLTKQLNMEGEIQVEGVATTNRSPSTRTLAWTIGPTNKNKRELMVGASQAPRLDHYDATVPTSVSSTATAIDWRQPWTVRGRWRAGQLLDVGGNYAGVAVTVGSALSTNYGRAATFSYDATANTKLELGGTSPVNCLLRRVLLRTCESKYD